MPRETDRDFLLPWFIQDPHEFFDELRESECPVEHTSMHGGLYVPSRYKDIEAVCRDHDNFSSVQLAIGPHSTDHPRNLPPITSDPPRHRADRDILKPFFTAKRLEALRAPLSADCYRLARKLKEKGKFDASAEYALPVACAAIERLTGLRGVQQPFLDWIGYYIEQGEDSARWGRKTPMGLNAALDGYIGEQLRAGGELAEHLHEQRYPNGQPLNPNHMVGLVKMMVMAGIASSWATTGSSIYHFAKYPVDKVKFLGAHVCPDFDFGYVDCLQPENEWCNCPERVELRVAIEELLRLYAAVNVTRKVKTDTEVNGCPYKKGETVLLSFGSANRDKRKFGQSAPQVDFKRKINPHLTFGAGVHRCLGANLGRMTLEEGLRGWLNVIMGFKLGGDVKWIGLGARKPLSLPIEVLP
jgi:cytochrome P450